MQERCNNMAGMFAVTKIQIFESNSQPLIAFVARVAWCSPSQRYKFLKAIHNRDRADFSGKYDVRRHKDTNFWKQFTTDEFNNPFGLWMFAVTKIQIFESNSQHDFIPFNAALWCSPSQRYKFLKAIHNIRFGIFVGGLMFAVTKIQIFESNSQHGCMILNLLNRCSPSQRYKFLKAIHNDRSDAKRDNRDVRRHKDTNFWKQFTTKSYFDVETILMFAVTKIQIFESNSQLRSDAAVSVTRCSPSQRYKFLKAIHNSFVTLISKV